MSYGCWLYVVKKIEYTQPTEYILTRRGIRYYEITWLGAHPILQFYLYPTNFVKFHPCDLLLLENRRDNIQLKQINQRLKTWLQEIIPGSWYAGGSQIAILPTIWMICRRLFVTQNLEQKVRINNYPVLYDGWVTCDQSSVLSWLISTAKNSWGWLKKMFWIEAFWNCSKDRRL